VEFVKLALFIFSISFFLNIFFSIPSVSYVMFVSACSAIVLRLNSSWCQCLAQIRLR